MNAAIEDTCVFLNFPIATTHIHLDPAIQIGAPDQDVIDTGCKSLEGILAFVSKRSP